ncbi:MAG: hypothetical protein K8E24_004055 [Methanobacterium paludis]|nr:hypothetical protein [Methanobacterium paludis]
MNKKRLLETFSDLVSIYSPSLSERLVCDYLSSKLSKLGFSLHEDLVGEKIGGNSGNLYGFLPGDESLEPLLFCAHMDTVEPASGKKVIFHDDGLITSNGETILGSILFSMIKFFHGFFSLEIITERILITINLIFRKFCFYM